MDICIIVASHKKYAMPADAMYLPLQVGAELMKEKDKNGATMELGYAKDNTGDNISALNPEFCELTGLYWAWKNLDSDYIGLSHYRRHFSSGRKDKNPWKRILTYHEIEPLLPRVKVFLPAPRKYYIETLSSHYAHTFEASHLEITRDILRESYPDYISAFDAAMKRTGGHMFNMLIMERSFLDRYCAWLFSVLFALYERVGVEGMSPFQLRYCGRVSELLLNVWVEEELRRGNLKKSEIMELPYIYMEPIDYPRKISSFLMAKFFGKRYERSF